MIFFPVSFNLPVFTNTNMNALVAAPKFNKSLRSCSTMTGSCRTEIKEEKIKAWYLLLDIYGQG